MSPTSLKMYWSQTIKFKLKRSTNSFLRFPSFGASNLQNWRLKSDKKQTGTKTKRFRYDLREKKKKISEISKFLIYALIPRSKSGKSWKSVFYFKNLAAAVTDWGTQVLNDYMLGLPTQDSQLVDNYEDCFLLRNQFVCILNYTLTF